jgi:hypothetical protein
MRLDLSLNQTLLINLFLFLDSVTALATVAVVLGQYLFGSSFPMLFGTLSLHSSLQYYQCQITNLMSNMNILTVQKDKSKIDSKTAVNIL